MTIALMFVVGLTASAAVEPIAPDASSKSLAAPPSAVPRDLAMMDLQAMHGVESSVASVLNESFLVELRRWNCFASVVGGSDLRAMMDLEQQRQALGCGDESCLVELGGALGVPYFFHASLSKLGQEYILHAKLLAVDDAKVLARGMSTATTEEALVRLPATVLKALLPKAFEGAKRSAPEVDRLAQRRAHHRMLWGRTAAGLSALGGIWAGWAYYDYHRIQSGYSDQAVDARTSTDYNTLKQTVSRANWMIPSGLSLAGIGALILVFR